MQRMTDALSRMLNDPSTRRAMRSLNSNRDRILLAAAQRESNPSEASPTNTTEEAQPQSDEPESAVTPPRNPSPPARESVNPVDSAETAEAVPSNDQSPQIQIETNAMETVSEDGNASSNVASDIPEPRSDL